MSNTIVRGVRVMRDLQSAGLIREPPAVLRPKRIKWGQNGYSYVDDCPGGLDESWRRWGLFEFRLRYFDGCFYPYVERRLRKAKPEDS